MFRTPTFPRPSTRFGKACRAFSLLELLVVVAIIGVLAALITPAMNGFGRSIALTNGGTLVTNLMTLARQTAMSKSTLTAVVLLTDAGTAEDYRAFTVLEYHAGVGNGSWWQIANWEVLPVGIVVDRSSTNVTSFISYTPTPFPFTGNSNDLPVTYQKKTLTGPSAFSARIFTPTGRLQNPDIAAQLRLVEGFNTSSQTVYTRRNDLKKAANYYDISIVGATGVLKIDRP